MPIETAAFINQLVPANPDSSDSRSTADDQIRLLKSVLQSQFPSLGAAAITRTAAQLNDIHTTKAAGDNTTAPASTAFVQQAIADVNAASGSITWSVSGDAEILLEAGQGVVGTNAGVITYTLPPSPSLGQIVAVSPANGRLDNLVVFGTNAHMGIGDPTMTLDIKDVTVYFLWTGAAYGWKLV